jgi:outer membrane receptor protein involved in Fe transport
MILLMFMWLEPPWQADTTHQPDKSAADLENFTLEQLVNEQVASVLKKETGFFTAPAAIYIINQEEIRRSGLTNIPKLLRLVSGLHVARVDANHWAITGRGFNSPYALIAYNDGPGLDATFTMGLPSEPVDQNSSKAERHLLK